MRTKVRIKDIKETDIKTTFSNGKCITEATIEYEGNSSIEFVTPEPKDAVVESDDPIELAKRLQRYCRGMHCPGCKLYDKEFPGGSQCKLSTLYNPIQWKLGDDK